MSQRFDHVVGDSGAADVRGRKGIEGINVETPTSLYLSVEGLSHAPVRGNVHAREIQPGHSLKDEQLRSIPSEKNDPPMFHFRLDGFAHGSLRNGKLMGGQ